MGDSESGSDDDTQQVRHRRGRSDGGQNRDRPVAGSEGHRHELALVPEVCQRTPCSHQVPASLPPAGSLTAVHQRVRRFVLGEQSRCRVGWRSPRCLIQVGVWNRLEVNGPEDSRYERLDVHEYLTNQGAGLIVGLGANAWIVARHAALRTGDRSAYLWCICSDTLGT